MKLSRCAVACALAFGAGGALAQSTGSAVTAESTIQLYGHLDLSVDSATKGIAGGSGTPSAAAFGQSTLPATGRLGWQADISSNLSYFGVRGSQQLTASGLSGVFQIETQVDVSATPGPSLSSSSSDASVKGALVSRNSFLGVAGGWGALKLGKTDAPYKLSTARMDPFSATVGDYNSIMGNTGGDNRAEFDTRLSHAAWYESPNMGGFRVNALFSPGQNRASDNSFVASGEPNCTGGNPPPCNDGSYDNAYSIAGIYEAGPVYGIVAYERHNNVNRTTDELANGGAAPDGSIGISNEYAFKAGVQYQSPTGTTLNFIWERMVRRAPAADFNERTRSGFWLAATQKISPSDDLNLGWGHAGKTPGDVGTRRSGDGFATGPVDNASNMYTVGYKHHFNRQANWYLVYARQVNHSGAHYDLGASGHGITTDCHDANGNCFAGSTLQAVSVGMQYNF